MVDEFLLPLDIILSHFNMKTDYLKPFRYFGNIKL